ncbi:carboxypeptidase regulatory-like domain-containing protein [Luteimonas sp. Y-2-2-4F]|nr:TonB-dependent receptor [Luteimonas sp. Y-2-2-4F]MCD9030694.1 carboxypeptidase regulatory-like domain-containing protein [Luteimonas sp. Y-2-2-4F]
MTPKHRVRLSRLSLGLIAALAAAPAFAQSTTSSGLAGTVMGNDGQPVSGAEVTIVHVESGTVSRATTDASGRYNARGLRVGGPYTVTINKAGAGTSTRDDVYLSLNQTGQVDAQLSGDMTTLGTVYATATAGSEVFSSAKMGAGTNLGLEQIEALPTIQRNLQDFVRLDPRVAQTDKGRLEISAGGQNPRYNAIRIDGVNTSDTFGLEASNFPLLRQPVSMDAIEAINVDLSNYDTTITGATGAVIDAVTKSGTNNFSGSVYYVYRDQDWVRDNEDGSPFSGFEDEETYGLTFGGPIVKDRLFFFANYEKFTRNSPSPSFGPIGSSASNIVGITQEEIAQAQQIARDVYGIDIGSLETPDGIKTELEEKAVKFDWNISDNHRLSYRYSETEQVDPVLAGSGENSLSLNSRWYDITKTFDSHSVQFFSDWSPNFSTEFKGSRRNYDSLSSVYARLPQMSIGFGPENRPDEPSSPYLNFGTDEFRHGNQVETTTDTLFGAATWYAGDHTVKFGFDWERNDVYNLYAQNIWGSYQFASLDHFRDGEYWQYTLNAPVPGRGLDSVAMNYEHKNLGLFVQDTWAVNYNLSLMFGLRVDIPDLDDVADHNLLVQEIYGLDNRNVLDAKLWQPRFGFNYTFDSDRPTQLRGGVGLFQGAAANVWVGNSYQNSGFGLIGYNQLMENVPVDQRDAIWASLPFVPDPDNPTTPAPAAGYQMMVNLMEDGIQQPSVWKANLAFDHELPWYGIVASAEALFTRVKDALHFERLDLGTPTGYGPDGRPLYWSNIAAGTGRRANGNTGVAGTADTLPGYENVTGWHNDGVILMKNTDKGSGQQFTFSLSKPLIENWAWSLGYTYTRATEVSPLTSSRAISNWSNKAIFDPNEDVAARSNYEIRDRVIGTLTFEKAFFGDYNTNFTLVYEGRSGRPHSWRFLNDANGDGYTNDLLYIPTGPGDVVFTGGAAMEQAFFEWLSGHPDLQRYAGGAAERNASRSGWINTFDLRISQELPGFFDGHKSEIWLDVMNVGNLLNKDWGQIVDQSPYSDLRAVTFAGVQDGKYVYNFDPNRVWSPVLYDDRGQSRWALQVGFRYKF